MGNNPTHSCKTSKTWAIANCLSILLMFLQNDGIRPGGEGYDPRTLYIPKDTWETFTPFEVQVCVDSSHLLSICFDIVSVLGN